MRAALLKSGVGITNQLEPLDCFKFHANYGNDVRLQYTRILAELANCNVLDYIVAALTGKYGVVQKISNTLDSDILQSEYAIT